MFSNHSAHAPVLFQYVFDELWWHWKLLEMLLDSAVKWIGRKIKSNIFGITVTTLSLVAHVFSVFQHEMLLKIEEQ